MKRSEKILLGVLGVVCLVAIYPFLMENGKNVADVSTLRTELAALAETMRAEVALKTAGDADLHAVKVLAAGVSGSPFYAATKTFHFADDEGEGTQSEFVYSGYLRFGNKAMAVINGIEYMVGEELAPGGYRVAAIGRRFVTLERTDGMTGRLSTRRIPIVEDEVEQINLRRVN